ncbi:MAG: CvpA family protein [Stenotrophomonas sp.]|uniref:CvpA family protein n=1 Tax=Stenotrophomonas sp. TaxID=69392 RepID=UPI003D6D5653
MVDLVLLAIIALSAVFGLIRGLLATVLGVASWLVAGWSAFRFGEQAALMLSAGMPPSPGEYIGGYLLVFIGALLAMAIVSWMLRGVVNSTVLLKGPDRLLGLCLGTLRGVLLAVLAVLLMGFTSMTEEPSWRESAVLPWLQPSADWLRGKLPQAPELSELPGKALMDLGKSVLTGDNAEPNEADAGNRWPPTVVDAGSPHDPLPQPDAGPSADPTRALPSNIDPAQVRLGQPDPHRVEVRGQARPPSR